SGIKLPARVLVFQEFVPGAFRHFFGRWEASANPKNSNILVCCEFGAIPVNRSKRRITKLNREKGAFDFQQRFDFFTPRRALATEHLWKGNRLDIGNSRPKSEFVIALDNAAMTVKQSCRCVKPCAIHKSPSPKNASFIERLKR